MKKSTKIKAEESEQTAPVANTNSISVNKNTLLIVILVVLAFVAGTLWNRTQTLEAQLKNGAPTTGTNTQQPPAVRTELKIQKPDAKKDHWQGDTNARFVMVEYSDLECPFCKQFHPTITQAFTDYAGKVAHVYRHFPLSFHQNAQKEAEAAECANELGGADTFWKYQDEIFSRTTSNGLGFSLDNLGPLAAELGMNQTTFQQCLDTNKYEQKVKDQLNEGSTSGVQATPTTVVYDMKTGKTHLVEGALPAEQFKTEVDAFMKAQGN